MEIIALLGLKSLFSIVSGEDEKRLLAHSPNTPRDIKV
jgi:hypothetical protein